MIKETGYETVFSIKTEFKDTAWKATVTIRQGRCVEDRWEFRESTTTAFNPDPSLAVTEALKDLVVGLDAMNYDLFGDVYDQADSLPDTENRSFVL